MEAVEEGCGVECRDGVREKISEEGGTDFWKAKTDQLSF